MSVIVKGMKMPANCQNCFASDDECRFCRAAKKYIPMLGKPKFCPLVALPDNHGRLVDADATIKEIKARNPDDVSYEDAWAITCIEHAPTIVDEES